jgi:hypothetical protein
LQPKHERESQVRPPGFFTFGGVMRGVKKENLPQKVCAVCGRPFTWRKKWARNWDEVKYCSDQCRRNARVRKGSP